MVEDQVVDLRGMDSVTLKEGFLLRDEKGALFGGRRGEAM